METTVNLLDSITKSSTSNNYRRPDKKKTLNKTHRFAIEAVAICIMNRKCEISITNAESTLNISFYPHTFSPPIPKRFMGKLYNKRCTYLVQFGYNISLYDSDLTVIF